MYLGSVKFFKHLIIGISFFILTIISVLIVYILHFLFYSNGNLEKSDPVHEYKVRAEEEKHEASEPESAASAENVSMPFFSGSEEKTGMSETKPYQLAYPDLYCEKSGEEIIKDNTVYLTFDDGPSQRTVEILNILKKNNVVATFFLIGKDDENSRDIMRRIVDEGHAIGIHSYTHDYGIIYQSVDAYLEDFHKMYQLIHENTGIKPTIFRFPGGSVNDYNREIYEEIIEEMNRRGFTYYDWNVCALDTLPNATATSIYNSVMNDVVKRSRSIALFHDSSWHNQTVISLEKIIKDIQKYGYTFDVLTNKVKPIVF